MSSSPLAMARELVAKPRLLLLDEPSLGLAPQLADEVLDLISSLAAAGMTILLVEQNAGRALELADRGYVLAGGRISLSGPAPDLLHDPAVQAAYLGT